MRRKIALPSLTATKTANQIETASDRQSKKLFGQFPEDAGNRQNPLAPNDVTIPHIPHLAFAAG